MFHNHVAQPEIYFNFQILRKKSRRQECLDWIITWISCFKSTFYFLLNRLRLHNMINIALFTAQNTYALLVGLVKGFSWSDTMVETVYCKACHYVSHIVFFLPPFPVDHCISTVEPFSPVALVVVPHMPMCTAEAFAFSGPLLGRYPWVRHIRIEIEQILSPLIPSCGTSVSGFPVFQVPLSRVYFTFPRSRNGINAKQTHYNLLIHLSYQAGRNLRTIITD